MAPDVGNSLQLLLFGDFFSLLLLLLEFEALGRSFELLLIDHEEVTRTSLREVRLCQDVLHSCDR